MDIAWTDLVSSPPLQAALIVMASFLAARIVGWLVGRTFTRWARRSRTSLDDEVLGLLHGPVTKTVVLLGLGLAAGRLDLGAAAATFTVRALQTMGLVVWCAFAFRLSGTLLNSARRHPERFRSVEDTTFPLFDNLAKLVIFAAGIYLLISTWDIDATGWLASAGIVGIGLGFAAKDTLSNLFAGVFIIADAPYRVGDYIVLESGERGQVVNIGIRSTRLLTRDDIEITVPNAIMGNSRIFNETRGPSSKRRVRVKVGAAYGSDVDQVRTALLEVAAAEDLVCQQPEPRVRFRAFGESGLDFELLCWIEQPELQGRVLDELNTAVYRRFAADKIEIPYPKRDVYVRELPGGAQVLGARSPRASSK